MIEHGFIWIKVVLILIRQLARSWRGQKIPPILSFASIKSRVKIKKVLLWCTVVQPEWVRTGVTSSIDAAIENIRALVKNEPIELLREMRQQRACLIQVLIISFKKILNQIN